MVWVFPCIAGLSGFLSLRDVLALYFAFESEHAALGWLESAVLPTVRFTPATFFLLFLCRVYHGVLMLYFVS